jgi:hypothetical protein
MSNGPFACRDISYSTQRYVGIKHLDISWPVSLDIVLKI